MIKARLPSFLLGLACLLPSTLAAQNACGVERWPVKIWADDDSARVDTVPIPITIAELVQIPAPLESRPQRNRVGDAEFKTFLVRGRLMAVLPQDDDSDIHVVLRDLEQPDATIVAEIPHPGCTAVERHAKLFEEARRALRTVPRNGVVEVLGIGFFDRLHGQRGMFPNGLEIHPVLRLRRVEDLTRQTLFASPLGSSPIPPDSVTRFNAAWFDLSQNGCHLVEAKTRRARVKVLQIHRHFVARHRSGQSEFPVQVEAHAPSVMQTAPMHKTEGKPRIKRCVTGG